MAGAGDGPHNGENDNVIFIDHVVDHVIDHVANGGVPNQPPIGVVYNQQDVIAINDDIVNIDNNDGITNDNVDDVGNREEIRWWDEFAESDTNTNTDTNTDEETEISPIENAKVPEDDPPPGPSKKRKRETDKVEEERPSKKVRRSDESAESSTDFNKESETSPIEHAKVPEDEPLPGPSKKRKRETDKVEEERPSKKVRRCDESAESSTDFNKESETSPIEHAQVPEDDPLPGPSKKRKRKTNRGDE
ncbi:hypothetical protein VZT92_011670 [Zoarces viviparus]|uniref:Uncharacterized protein n=1 Tax=Zoarces viviparus TaxID=48416 RepID=A0AAW1F623_ZOAVI